MVGVVVGATKSIFPSASLSIPSAHCARAAFSSEVSVALVQPGSSKSMSPSVSLSIVSLHATLAGGTTGGVHVCGLVPPFLQRQFHAAFLVVVVGTVAWVPPIFLH